MRGRRIGTGEQQPPPPSRKLGAGDFAAGTDRDALRQHRIVKRAEQARAVDPQAAGARHAEIGIARVEDGLAVRIAAVDARDLSAVGGHFLGQAKLGEHGEPGRLDHQARAERARRREPFVNRDRVALPIEQQRRREPRDAAAGDGDVEIPHGGGA